MYTTISYSLFEIVYGFDQLTPLNLIQLPVDERNIVDGKKKAELVKLVYERFQLQIEKKNEHYASQANKRRKCVTFDLEDWIGFTCKKNVFQPI